MRHMIVLSGILNLKNDCDLRIEGVDIIVGEVSSGIEDKTIHASFDRCFVRHQIGNPAIRVCRSFAN